GEYRSCFKGAGVEFEDIRQYQYGDDVRAMDWNVTARTGQPYVRIFNEERELTVYFLIDVSTSMMFGSAHSSKRDVSAQLCTLLAYAAHHHHDRVGAILFSDIVEEYLGPGKSKKHMRHLISRILACKPQSQGTDLARAMAFFQQVRQRRSVVFLFSDFPEADYWDALRETGRKHDLICVKICDPREKILPQGALVCLQDSESNDRITLDCYSSAHREWIRSMAHDREIRLRTFCRETGADFLVISTQEDYLHQLISFLRWRQQKNSGTGRPM
ncbi:MAG: DUF58 domain-containing protein, partial [Lentisphaerae bacterium]